MSKPTQLDLSKIPLNTPGLLQTENGDPAELVCNNGAFGRSTNAFACIIRHKDGSTGWQSYAQNGWCDHDRKSPYGTDLVAVKKKIKIEGWLNVYPDGEVCFHLDRARADREAGLYRLACVPFSMEVEEGEGL